MSTGLGQWQAGTVHVDADAASRKIWGFHDLWVQKSGTAKIAEMQEEPWDCPIQGFNVIKHWWRNIKVSNEINKINYKVILLDNHEVQFTGNRLGRADTIVLVL